MYLINTQKILEGEKRKYNNPAFTTHKSSNRSEHRRLWQYKGPYFPFPFLLQPTTLFPTMAKWEWGLFHQVVTPALGFFIPLGT